ncbi:MAG: carbohydrate kinase family protein [Planctomycetes bacterium]|nr:carbohydrate kinase family protein [Planctomycetota bacterium]
MNPRAQIARQAADALKQFAARMTQSPVAIGFDGFVDSIMAVVDQRTDADHYTPFATIDAFGKRVLAAAGQSSNYELVTKLQKLGGNGPIMANAMATIGFPVTYIGNVGYPAVHPAFEPLAEKATCISFAEPGYTDALEFTDGKLMMGKHSSLKDVNAEQLRQVVGDDRLRDIMGKSVLIGMVNWAMLTRLNEIWNYMLADVLPKVAGRRWVFIDLTDPEKRTRDDLRGALQLCGKFQKYADTILGCNLKESTQVAQVLGIDVGSDPEANIVKTAGAIREKVGLHTVVIHPRAGAAAATINGDAAYFAGPLVKEPKLSTGAGDNFNAGFCTAMIAGLPIEQALCVGTATSGSYVRNAASPTLADLAAFCQNLPDPQ